jgi:hypothetical protein
MAFDVNAVMAALQGGQQGGQAFGNYPSAQRPQQSPQFARARAVPPMAFGGTAMPQGNPIPAPGGAPAFPQNTPMPMPGGGFSAPAQGGAPAFSPAASMPPADPLAQAQQAMEAGLFPAQAGGARPMQRPGQQRARYPLPPTAALLGGQF